MPRCHLSDLLERELSVIPVHGPQICVRVVNMSQDSCDTKPMFRSRYPDHVQEYPYMRKVVLAFYQSEALCICFFG